MKIEVDTHTHSIASGHAYSTIDELARGARRRGLKGFVITEHGPALQGYPHRYYFGNLRVLPEKMRGVFVFHGAELNIMDTEGTVDLDGTYVRPLHFVMAGLHEQCFESQSAETNTRTLIAAIENPLVDGISHPGNPVYPADFEAVVQAAVRAGKTLEINNSSFRVRAGSDKSCREFAAACKKHGALITCGSDAHTAQDAGNFKTALAVIKEAGIDKDKIVNRTLASFLRFCAKRKAERAALR
ncbi:MAG: PHP domain-containing protein [Spirochaetaceae bacterium]|jgi:putative hydrolase|nr:PHP domain-containing protein [Spirochaetaceae bacterium]